MPKTFGLLVIFKKLFIISSKPDMLRCYEYKKQISNPSNAPKTGTTFYFSGAYSLAEEIALSSF